MIRLTPIAAALSLAFASQLAAAATSAFGNFTPLASSVSAGSLSEEAPLLLSSPKFSQVSPTATPSSPMASSTAATGT